jgi:hypothetical protein
MDARVSFRHQLDASLAVEAHEAEFNFYGEVDEETARRRRLLAYDRLPEVVRQALLESPFDLHIGQRIQPFMDCTALIQRIKAIASEKEAVQFNEDYAGRGFGRAW